MLLSGCSHTERTSYVDAWRHSARAVPGASKQISARDLIRTRDIGGESYAGGLVFSKDGSLVAFQVQQANPSSGKYATAWYVSSTVRGAEPRFVGEGGEPILLGEYTRSINGGRVRASAFWSHDQKWIYYPLKRDGVIELWRSDVNGGYQERISFLNARVQNIALSLNGKTVVFDAVPTKRTLLALNEDEARSGYLFDDRFSPSTSLVPEFNPEQGRTFWAFDIESQKVRPARESEIVDLSGEKLYPSSHPLNTRVLGHSAKKSADHDEWLWLETANLTKRTRENCQDRVLLTANSNAIESPAECLDSSCRGYIVDAWWHREEIVFLRREGYRNSKSVLYAWNPRVDRIRQVYGSGQDQIFDCGISNATLICLREKWTMPRHVVSIDLSNGRLSVLIDPNPEYRQYEFSEIEELKWGDDRSVKAHGHLVYPHDYDASRRYPLVIVQYRSRGFLRGGTGDEAPIHVLAANGFFVLSFDRPDRYSYWMTSAEREQAADRAGKRFDPFGNHSAVRSLEIIIDQLIDRGLIDPRRIGITGLSDGAETARIALWTTNRFSAASVSKGGFSKHNYQLANEANRKALERIARLHVPGSDMVSDGIWKNLSADQHVDKIAAPLLLQVSDSELLVSLPIFVALREHEKPVDMYVYPGEYHIKFDPRHKYSVYRRNLQWFKFWLQGIESDDPVDPNQYERWSKMRKDHCANLMVADVDRLPSYCNSALLGIPRMTAP